MLTFDGDDRPSAIVEKPEASVARWAVTGLYVYDSQAPDRAAALAPSARGELEITDVNAGYLAEDRLSAVRLGRGFAWFDAGTHDDLLAAGEFVRTVEARQNLKIACPEEIAWRKSFIATDRLRALAQSYAKFDYGLYLHGLADERP
mgnify:CR=1 FL=1